MSRLASVRGGADNESFQYDADGNRLTANINGTVETYTYAATSNRLMRATVSGWPSQQYGYDA